MKIFKNSICLLFVIFALSACSNRNDREYGTSGTQHRNHHSSDISNDLEYGISGTYAEIKAMQILDPMAPENNAGIVNALEGNVANKVIKGYQGSTYAPKEGRTATTAE
jgi:hypothetical protein